MTRQIAGVLVLAVLVCAAPRAQEPERLFKAAMNTELVDGDLRAAIEQYRQVAGGTDRALAAQALLRMAECYEKLGDIEAQAIYGRVVEDYADQQEVVSIARTRLRTAVAATPAALTASRVLDVGRSWDRVSPDGRYLARPDQAETGNLALLELATGNIRWLTSDGHTVHPDEQVPYSSAFSGDGRQIAYEWAVEKEGRGTLRIIETAEGANKAPRTLYDNPDVQTVAPTDWSPDGRWIAAVVRRHDQTAQVGVISVADGSLRVLKTVDWSRVGGLRFSPDSSLLAYHRPSMEGGFERDVFVLAVDGSREVLAASSPGDDFLLEWMPTGDRLLIASERGGSMSAWTVPAVGPGANSAFELVKSDIGTVSSLGPTRDGTLFYHVQPGGSDLHVAQFDLATGQLSSTPEPLLKQFKGRTGGAQWSADGRYLAYASRVDIPAPINTTRPVVTILSAESGDVVRELHPKLSYGGMGAWSPDGGLLAVRGADLKGRDGIVLVDAQTGDARHVAYNETCSGVPYWAPDGASFFCYDFAESAIVRMNTSGTVLRRYAAAAQGTGVSPDGRYVAHWGEESVLQLIDLSTGESREAPLEGRFTLSGFPAWTPDGSLIAYGRLRGDQALWFVPIDGRPPHKIDTNGLDIRGMAINPKTSQVVFNVNEDWRRPQLEVWKMEGLVLRAGSGTSASSPSGRR